MVETEASSRRAGTGLRPQRQRSARVESRKPPVGEQGGGDRPAWGARAGGSKTAALLPSDASLRSRQPFLPSVLAFLPTEVCVYVRACTRHTRACTHTHRAVFPLTLSFCNQNLHVLYLRWPQSSILITHVSANLSRGKILASRKSDKSFHKLRVLGHAVYAWNTFRGKEF